MTETEKTNMNNNKNLTVRISTELYEKLVEYAKSQETGVSSIVRLALKEYLSNH